MPFEYVYQNLLKLAGLPSTNDKEELVLECLKNKTFQKTMKYALSQGWTYSIREVPYHKVPLELESADELFEFLEYLREKGSANETDKNQLSRLSSASLATLYVVNCITQKDIKCGVGVKTINKIKPKTCHLVPYQRCSSEEKIGNVQYPALIQKKADSMFSYALPFKEKDVFLTRGGQFYDVLSATLQKELKTLIDGKEVLVGECQVLDEQYINVLPRKAGNGILNSIIQGTATQEQMERVIYDVWDIIPYDAFLEQSYKVNIVHRFNTLQEREKRIRGDAVQVIPYEYVSSEQEARDFYAKMRSMGYEGAILKNFNDHWKFNTSPMQIKLKNQSVAEFEIIDAYYGEKNGRFADLLGGITIRSACGKIVSNCGGGFSDKERKLGVDWWKEQIGKIAGIKFESVIEDKTTRETYKLYSPQFDEIRNDKIEADTLEYCLEISTGKRT